MMNPMVDVDSKANTTRAETYRASGNIYGEVDFLEHFNFRAVFSMDYIPDAEMLYQYAENTLDHAKAQGKNRLLFFSADDYEREIAALELKEELTKSVQAGFQGFSLAYQPQVLSATYQIYGAEALLRYTSPRRGSVPPSEFVPILEQSKLICPVGIWILDTALKQCRLWREAAPDFHISINVSYTQLCEADIVQKVLDAVNRSGLPG